MSLIKLETELLKVKEELGKVKGVNSEFEKVINEMATLKQRALSNPLTKKQITEEIKNKEILDLFASVEKDFDDLKTQLSRQSIEREKIADFVESLRTKKSFSFAEVKDALLFIQSISEEMECSHIVIKPEFIGMVDLGPIAIELGLHKTNSGIIIESERLSETLALMLRQKMLRNVIFETDNVKLTYKTNSNIIAESDNTNIKKISRLAKKQ